MSVRRNTFINLAGYVVPMVVMLGTVPLYLKVLGDVRYGVLALVWLVLGYFSFLEMGLGKSTANHIARLRDASPEERQVIFWTALTVNGAFGLAASVVLGILGSHVLNQILKSAPAFRSEAITALPWMIATLPLALVSSVLNGTLEGSSRFVAVNVLQVVTNVVFQTVPLAVAYAYGASLGIVIPAAVLSRALMNIPFFIACYRVVPLGRRPRISRPAARSLLAFGGWVALTGAVGSLLDTVDRVIVGVALGPQAVTYYTVPSQLVNKARVIPGSLGRALFPRFSGDSPRDSDRLATSSLLSLNVIMTPLIAAGIVFLDPFMSLWVGRTVATSAAPVGEVMLLGVWFASLAHIPYFLLQGKGKPGVVGRLQLLEVAPFLLVFWAALQTWGLTGGAWAWTLRVGVDAVLLFRMSGMPRHDFRALWVPTLLLAGAVGGSLWIGPAGWALRGALALCIVIVIALWLRSFGALGVLSRMLTSRAGHSTSEEAPQ